MKRYIVSTALLTFVFGACPSQAGKLSRANAEEQNNAVIKVYPELPFDEAAFRTAMAPGSATIGGTVSARVPVPHYANNGNGGSYVAYWSSRDEWKSGVSVSLFPATPYLLEVVKIQNALMGRAGQGAGVLGKLLGGSGGSARYVRGPGRKELGYAPEMYNYQLTTKTDDYGRFFFKGLKPGKYYIFATATHVYQRDQNVQTGTSSNGVDSVTHYETVTQNVERGGLLDKVVTVKADGSFVEVELKIANGQGEY